MCVIIVRNPGVKIDPKMIETACHVNPDGFGMAVIEKGKMIVLHELNLKNGRPQKNDAKRVNELLDKYINCPLLLHLRFRTHGEVNLANCQPIRVLTKEKHGMDVVFAHNGTLSAWGNLEPDKSKSDSVNLVEQYLRPMLERSLAYTGRDKLLDDDYTLNQIEDQCNNTSKFVVMADTGQHFIVNEDAGHQYDGWWASNTYSFQRDWREPKYTNNKRPGNRSGSYSWERGRTGTHLDYDPYEEYNDDYGNKDYADNGFLPANAEGGGQVTGKVLPFGQKAAEALTRIRESAKALVAPDGATLSTPKSGPSSPMIGRVSALILAPASVEDIRLRNHLKNVESSQLKQRMTAIMAKAKNSTAKEKAGELVVSESMLVRLTQERESFSSLAGVKLEDVLQMEATDLQALVLYFPQATKALLCDLLKLVYLEKMAKNSDRIRAALTAGVRTAQKAANEIQTDDLAPLKGSAYGS